MIGFSPIASQPIATAYAPVSLTQVMSFAGISSDEAFGSIEITPGAVSFSLPGIEGDAMVPNPTFSVGGSTVSLVAIPSEEFVGLPVLSPGAVSFSAAFISESSVLGDIHFSPGPGNIQLSSIHSAEAVSGFEIVNFNHSLNIASIQTDEFFGDIRLYGGTGLSGYMNADIFTGPPLLGVVEVNVGH